MARKYNRPNHLCIWMSATYLANQNSVAACAEPTSRVRHPPIHLRSGPHCSPYVWEDHPSVARWGGGGLGGTCGRGCALALRAPDQRAPDQRATAGLHNHRRSASISPRPRRVIQVRHPRRMCPSRCVCCATAPLTFTVVLADEAHLAGVPGQGPVARAHGNLKCACPRQHRRR